MSAHLRRTLERHATWPAVIAWAFVIFGLSSIPNNFEPSESLIPADKIAHAIEFAVLALLATWAFARWRHADVVFAHAAVGFVLASAYGVTDETLRARSRRHAR
jgi:uncharacterized MnhB-related membrane protein